MLFLIIRFSTQFNFMNKLLLFIFKIKKNYINPIIKDHLDNSPGYFPRHMLSYNFQLN